MGKRDTSTVRTAKRRLAGHVSTGPTGVLAQSSAAMSRPASPPAANRPFGPGPEGKPGTAPTYRSPPAEQAATRPARRTYLRSLGTRLQPLDHVVDALRQGGHVVGVGGGGHADPPLVAAEVAVGLGVDDAVRAQYLGHLGGVDGVGEVDRADDEGPMG